MIERRLTGEQPLMTLPKGAIDTQTHMYLPGYAAAKGFPGLPEGLPGPGEYASVMDWLGIERVVVTQGNAHGFDNANLLACLAALGGIARGVAVITAQTTHSELGHLHDAGVRGARIMDLPGGAVGLDGLEAVDEKAAAMGWMMAVQFDGGRILDQVDRLSKLKSRFVIDHHGKFFSGTTPQSKEVAALKGLIDGGRCWYKFAGVYESSLTGGPDYADVAATSRSIAAHAPERIVWGTNWPHNLAKVTAHYPDDRALTDTVLGWLDGDGARHKALVDNPQELFGFAD